MSHALIAKIHIAKNQLGLDDDTYRQLLHTATGKTSCANMANWERELVLDAMRAKGFKSQKGSYNKKLSPKSGTSKHPEIDKIRAIWITMSQHGIVKDGSETALNAYVKRMTKTLNQGAGVESVGWLNPQQVIRVLEGLKSWHRRILADRLTAIGVTTIEQHKTTKPVHVASYDYVAQTYKFWQKRGKL